MKSVAYRNGSTEESLSQSGYARRRLLAGTALAGAGTCVGAVLPNCAHAVAQSSTEKCPDVRIPMKDVEGKVAFITGGSSGIGLGIARACADAGMKVVIGYRTKGNVDQAMTQLASARGRVHPIGVDVTDRGGMENAAAETVKVFGKVHLLVNNAGVISGKPISESTYDDWDWVLSVNATGIFNGVRAFLPHIKVHGEGGQIVTTSSVLGLVANGGALGIYATSKFAAVGMMEALRADLAAINIGASVYCPGYVKTSLWDATRNRPHEFSETAYEPREPKEKERIRAAVARADWAMDPFEAGRLVLRGIRNNDLYILTHPEFERGIRDRNEALIASIPQDLNPPDARVSAEQGILRNAAYIAERDRKRCSRR